MINQKLSNNYKFIQNNYNFIKNKLKKIRFNQKVSCLINQE